VQRDTGYAASLGTDRRTPDRAETLWALVDEPIVNKHVETIHELDEIIGKRCGALTNERDAIKSRAGFHWWPKIANAN